MAKCLSEDVEQIIVADWLRFHTDIPFFHIANQRATSAKHGVKLKRMGVRAGVPDLFIPVSRGGFHGLWIEMKAGKQKATKEQVLFLARMHHEGYMGEVCHGAQQAIDLIKYYLTLDGQLVESLERHPQ